MCGIWGLAINKPVSEKAIKKLIRQMLILSELRGKGSSGVALFSQESMGIYREDCSAQEMVQAPGYKKFLSDSRVGSPLLVIGSAGKTANGPQGTVGENQPVSKRTMTTVLSGTIVNADALGKCSKHEYRPESNTEFFATFYEGFREDLSVREAFQRVYREIYGIASTLSILQDTPSLVAATNNGSLHYCIAKDGHSILFVSEKHILKALLMKNGFAKDNFNSDSIQQVCADTGMIIDPESMQIENIELPKSDNTTNYDGPPYQVALRISLDSTAGLEIDDTPIKVLRRCSRCIMPETMPFIEFDEDGVCNYCRTYKKQEYEEKCRLYEWADALRCQNKRPDSVVSFSGGRDSSYGLHFFVKELGLSPVAYSYDWGMVTDLAGRNQSRMCAKLGVELIVVSADIGKKRANIRRNVSAWLKRPDLGTVPLFMSGDKQYFYYANKVRKDFGLDTVLMASNPFEKTYFKAGFCGVKPAVLRTGEVLEVEQLKLGDIAKMSGHYLGQFVTNPRYLNRSLGDTITATASYYAIPHNYFRLFNYIPWEEEVINNTLIQEYNWEVSPETRSTWRIGDGTAPFYNYIYYLVAGFSENDTLRSNQIREGMLTREQALGLIYQDNAPRFDSMQWYFDVIGVDMRTALSRVQSMPRLYQS